MTDQAMRYVTSSAPWKRGVPWPIIVIEGIIAIVIGIYMLVDPSDARSRVRQLIALIVLINGLLEIAVGFRNPGSKAAPYRILRGTIGATIGFIITLEWFFDFLDDDGSRWILAIGLAAIGLVGLVIVAVTRDEVGLRIGPLVTNLVFLLIAVLLFTGDEEKTSRIEFIGVIFIVLGALLCAYSYYLYRSGDSEGAAASGSGEGTAPQAPSPTASA